MSSAKGDVGDTHTLHERLLLRLSFWAGVIGGRSVVLIGMLHLVEKSGVEIDVLSLSVPFLEVETTPCCCTDNTCFVAPLRKKTLPNR